LIDLQVRLKLREMSQNRSQKEMILLLGEIGISGGEIASLLGASPTTVHPTLSKARSKTRKKRSSRSSEKGETSAVKNR
jgi:DNA-directed RNA polymerase specialized sigma24 family protein